MGSRRAIMLGVEAMAPELLVAKRDLSLPRALRRLDVLILDDIGYVQQSPDEIEVLS